MGIDFEGSEGIQNLDFGFGIKDKDKGFRIFGSFGGDVQGDALERTSDTKSRRAQANASSPTAPKSSPSSPKIMAPPPSPLPSPPPLRRLPAVAGRFLPDTGRSCEPLWGLCRQGPLSKGPLRDTRLLLGVLWVDVGLVPGELTSAVASRAEVRGEAFSASEP